MASEHGGPGFATGLVLGGIIGALAGLILAPGPGEDTLAQLKEKTTQLRARAEVLAAEARQRVRGAIEEGRAVASRRRASRPGASLEELTPDNLEEPAS